MKFCKLPRKESKLSWVLRVVLWLCCVGGHNGKPHAWGLRNIHSLSPSASCFEWFVRGGLCSHLVSVSLFLEAWNSAEGDITGQPSHCRDQNMETTWHWPEVDWSGGGDCLAKSRTVLSLCSESTLLLNCVLCNPCVWIISDRQKTFFNVNLINN